MEGRVECDGEHCLVGEHVPSLRVGIAGSWVQGRERNGSHGSFGHAMRVSLGLARMGNDGLTIVSGREETRAG